MKKTKNYLYLLSIIFITSINGQNKTQPVPSNISAFQANTTTEPGKSILCIFQDLNNIYWFGTNGQGVYRYDEHGNTLIQFTDKDGLCDNQVNSIQEDKSGNIWIGTSGGISCFDAPLSGRQEINFTKFPNHEKKPSPGKPGKELNTGKDDLWFKAGGGAYRYNGNSFSYTLLTNPDSKHKNTTDPQKPNSYKLNPYSVYCSLKDKKGNLWFGTQTLGVCRYDGKSFTWLSEKGLAGPAVLAIFEDRYGNMWFGNNGKGLFRYDGKTLSNFTEEKELSNPDFLNTGKSGPGTLARVLSINEDSAGNLWIGTVDAGVWRYDGRNLTNYSTKEGLPARGIETIYKDKKGGLWFGTDGAGVFKFNGVSFSKFQY
ncbi:MAG: two-component regulator propeller domain-containing protein [Saprospiraceae bacterium]